MFDQRQARVIAFVAAVAAGFAAVPSHLAKESRTVRFDRLAPIAALAPADAAAAEKLRDLLGFGAEHIIPRGSDRASVAAFYRLRGFTPLWVENGAPSDRAVRAVAYLATVADDGLEPSDYAPIHISAALDASAVAAAELAFTGTVVRFARDAYNGRTAFSRVSTDIDYPRKLVKAREILSTIAQATNPVVALAAFNPPQQGYRALRGKLTELRGRDHNADAVETASAAVRHSILPAEDILIANMERWRWLPRDLGGDFVMVNVPDYTLVLTHNGAPVFRTNLVVGAPDSPTPLISAAMSSITINPIWNIPPAIVENEYLPALARDPNLAAGMDLRVARNPNGKIRIWQPPGEGNVLGRVRFNFPNRFFVYQHDSDEKFVVGMLQDASHGCMRVKDPFGYAVALLAIAAPRGDHSEERLRSLIGDREVEIALPRPIPVHLTYQTAFVDEDGGLAFRDDIYALDLRTLAALKAPEAAGRLDMQATRSASQEPAVTGAAAR
jgi:murein L,D-transpeptidase YcbB/YkuD